MMRTIIGFSFLLLISTKSLSQNVGIGTVTPLQKLHVEGNTFVKDSLGIGIDSAKAKLDVNGSVLFRGRNANNFNNTVNAGLEFFWGRSSSGSIPTDLYNADIAFNFGGANAGYRHFLSTRHNSVVNSNGNAIDFSLNNSVQPGGSTMPGVGNRTMLSITAKGLGIDNMEPNAPLQLANSYANRKIVLYDAVTGNPNDHEFYGFGTGVNELRYHSASAHIFYSAIDANTSQETFRINKQGNVNMLGRLAIGTTNVPVEKLYVNGAAKVENDFLVGGSSIFSNRVNMLDRLAIGTGAFPGERLYVNGLAKIEGNFAATGISTLGTLNVSGSAAIGGSTTINGDANMTGNAYVTNNLSVNGNVNMGLTYQFSDYTIAPNQTVGVSISCPAGTQLLSGGGGNYVFNGGTDEVYLNYSGPDPNYPLKVWQIYARNTGSVNRPLRIYCLCARIN